MSRRAPANVSRPLSPSSRTSAVESSLGSRARPSASAAPTITNRASRHVGRDRAPRRARRSPDPCGGESGRPSRPGGRPVRRPARRGPSDAGAPVANRVDVDRVVEHLDLAVATAALERSPPSRARCSRPDPAVAVQTAVSASNTHFGPIQRVAAVVQHVRQSQRARAASPPSSSTSMLVWIRSAPTRRASAPTAAAARASRTG